MSPPSRPPGSTLSGPTSKIAGSSFKSIISPMKSAHSAFRLGTSTSHVAEPCGTKAARYSVLLLTRRRQRQCGQTGDRHNWRISLVHLECSNSLELLEWTVNTTREWYTEESTDKPFHRTTLTQKEVKPSTYLSKQRSISRNEMRAQR